MFLISSKQTLSSMLKLLYAGIRKDTNTLLLISIYNPIVDTDIKNHNYYMH